jgi:type I restriction enzyme S subunit
MRLVKLSEICIFAPPKSEAREKLKSEDVVSFMPMHDLGIESIYAETSTVKPLSEVIKSYTYFAENDVLVAKITPCFENGKMGIARNLVNGVGFGSSEYFVLRPTESILSEYLYYYLRQGFVIDNGRGIMTGAVGHRRVPLDYLENLVIPLPSLLKQRKIVEKLGSAFSELDLLDMNLDVSEKKLSELLESHLSASFFHSGVNSDIPHSSSSQAFPVEKIEMRKLRDVISIQNGYAFSSKNFTVDEGIPLIRIRDLKNGVTTQTNYFGDYDESYLVDSGDLLIGMDGEFRCYEWLGGPALLNQRVCRLQSKSDVFDLKYLFYGINSYLKAIEAVTGYTTVKHLSSSTILDIDFPVPSLKEQKKIVKNLEEINIEIESLKSHLLIRREFAGMVKRSLLSECFSFNEELVSP